MNKAYCFKSAFLPFGLFLVLSVTIVSCQKEGSIELEPVPVPVLKDTIASVVIDGDYGGYSNVDFDSAVLKYTAGSVTINHYTHSAVLMAVETIQYDNAQRVALYQQADPFSSYSLSRKFTYTGIEPIPSVIDDTLTIGSDVEISKVQVAARNSAGNTTTWNINTSFKYPSNPVFNGNTVGSTTFDNSWRLLSFTHPFGYTSKYYYNAAGNLDSCLALTPGGGDDSYARLWYTGESNPLTEFSQFIYKNLANYSVVDNLNNSYYENFLDIIYFPSELLTTKIPLKSTSGINARQLENENTFLYTVENKELKGIIVNHKDLFSGDISQTRIRFHKR